MNDLIERLNATCTDLLWMEYDADNIEAIEKAIEALKMNDLIERLEQTKHRR